MYIYKNETIKNIQIRIVKLKYIKYHKYQTLIINKKLTFENFEIFRGINLYLKTRIKIVKRVNLILVKV